MLTLGHRTRVVILAALFAMLALMLFSRRTHAAWSADPVEVHATTALCPLVSVAGDAAQGALIVWQEETATGGLLRARHLLANGDVDAAWGAPVVLSTADAARAALGSVSDGAGGAYVWWMEGTQLYLTRLAAEGAVATGWPARGRQIGTLASAGSRPVVVSDGSGGVYAAWLTAAVLPPSSVTIRAHHLGPANTAKDGWPNSGRTLADTQANSEQASTFGIGAAGDGGLWLAYATTTELEPGVYSPGEARVARYTGAGLPASGWTAAGVAVAEFRGDLLAGRPEWGIAPPSRLAAIAEDGSGGAIVLSGLPYAYDEFTVAADYRLHRVNSLGTLDPGWPAEGRPATTVGFPMPGSGSADLSLRLHADGAGGVHAGRPSFFLHGGSNYSFDRYSELGLPVGESAGAGDHGIESASRGDGGVVVGSYFPHGPSGLYQPSAFVGLNQTQPGGSFIEWHDDPVVQWYGDIGLAATGDGGTIFAWSQVKERFGVFAIRMNPAGQVTGVPPGTASRGLRVWYARGSGVQVYGATGPMTLRLHDLTGREIARGESADAGEWTVPGTEGLPSGMYFAKAVTDGQELLAKVIVIR